MISGWTSLPPLYSRHTTASDLLLLLGLPSPPCSQGGPTYLTSHHRQVWYSCRTLRWQAVVVSMIWALARLSTLDWSRIGTCWGLTRRRRRMTGRRMPNSQTLDCQSPMQAVASSCKRSKHPWTDTSTEDCGREDQMLAVRMTSWAVRSQCLSSIRIYLPPTIWSWDSWGGYQRALMTWR